MGLWHLKMTECIFFGFRVQPSKWQGLQNSFDRFNPISFRHNREKNNKYKELVKSYK